MAAEGREGAPSHDPGETFTVPIHVEHDISPVPPGVEATEVPESVESVEPATVDTPGAELSQPEPPHLRGPDFREYLSASDAQKAQLEIELQHFAGNEPGNDLARRHIQEQIDQLDQKMVEARGGYAKEIVTKLESGGKITEEERLVLVQNLNSHFEKSALAEVVLARHGFKTFQEALGKLNVRSVRVEDIVIQLEKDHKNPWIKQELKKFGISGGTSLATVGLISLLGGPISWAGVLGGLVGGAAGRLGGEWWRHRALSKDGLGDRVAKDLLQVIRSLQTEAGTALAEAGTNEEQRAMAIANILEATATKEVESVQRYQKLEKNFSKVKVGLGILGAGLGSLGASALWHGHEQSAALAQAQQQGVRIQHIDNVAHITTDPSLGHEVHEMNDGLWRFMLDQKNVADAASHPDWLHYYTGAGTSAQVPGMEDFMKVVAQNGGKSLMFHADTTGIDVLGAINRDIWHTTWTTMAAMAGSSAVAGMGIAGWEHHQLSAKRLREHNRPLIDQLEAEAVRVRRTVPAAPEAVPAAFRNTEPTPASAEIRLFGHGQQIDFAGKKWQVGDVHPGVDPLYRLDSLSDWEAGHPHSEWRRHSELSSVPAATQPEAPEPTPTPVPPTAPEVTINPEPVTNAKYPVGQAIRFGGQQLVVGEAVVEGGATRYRLAGQSPEGERFSFWKTEEQLDKSVRGILPEPEKSPAKEPTKPPEPPAIDRRRYPRIEEIFQKIHEEISAPETDPDIVDGMLTNVHKAAFVEIFHEYEKQFSQLPDELKDRADLHFSATPNAKDKSWLLKLEYPSERNLVFIINQQADGGIALGWQDADRVGEYAASRQIPVNPGELIDFFRMIDHRIHDAEQKPSIASADPPPEPPAPTSSDTELPPEPSGASAEPTSDPAPKPDRRSYPEPPLKIEEEEKEIVPTSPASASKEYRSLPEIVAEKGLDLGVFETGKELKFREATDGDKGVFLNQIKEDFDVRGSIGGSRFEITKSTPVGDDVQVTLRLNDQEGEYFLSQLLNSGLLDLPKSARRK